IIPTNRLGVIAQMGQPEADLYLHSDFFLEGSPEGKPSTDDIDRLYGLLGKTKTYESPLAALNAALADRGLAGQPIGVDEMRIAPEWMTKLQASLPQHYVQPAYKLFREIRQIKTQTEIERLRAVATLNEQAEKLMIERIQP